jgi:hypothetical protein
MSEFVVVGPGDTSRIPKRPCAGSCCWHCSRALKLKLHFESVQLTGVPALFVDLTSASSRSALVFRGEETTNPEKGERRSQARGASAVASGKGRRRGRRRHTDPVWCGARGEQGLLGYSCAPAGPRAETRAGCSALAVVSAGSGKVHANCGNGDASKVAAESEVHSAGSSQAGHLESVTQVRPPLINSVQARSEWTDAVEPNVFLTDERRSRARGSPGGRARVEGFPTARSDFATAGPGAAGRLG